MSTLLVELSSKEVLTGVVAKRLRRYISSKYPGLSPALRAGIFADAVNRMISGKLPELPEDRISLFKAFLYGDAAKKQVFSIDCSDIFKSSIKLNFPDDNFIKSLKIWLEEVLLTPVSQEKVYEYIHNASSILCENPDMDIEKVLESVESKVGDIRPKKRVISVIRINPPAAVDETDSVIFKSDGADVLDEGGENKEAACSVDAGKEDTGKDWVIIKRKKSVKEIIKDGILLLAADVKEIFRKTYSSGANMLSRKTAYKRAITAGLITVALLCAFLSALYVKAIEKQNSTKVDFLKNEDFSSIFNYMSSAASVSDNEAVCPDQAEGGMLRLRATAYDLSAASCGKDREHPEYGITFSGTRATVGRTVAVDPEVIPLGSSVRITFPEEYSYMDGVYVAEDTGRLIKGKSIDIFFGEDKNGSNEINRKALQFGVQYVDVEIIDTRQALR